jgi:hypothetical protein
MTNFKNKLFKNLIKLHLLKNYFFKVLDKKTQIQIDISINSKFNLKRDNKRSSKKNLIHLFRKTKKRKIF